MTLRPAYDEITLALGAHPVRLRPSLRAACLRELLHYDPATGLFRWRVSRGKSKAGNIAGTPGRDGYLKIGIDGKQYQAHRLAFLYMTGEWPENQIDHRDLDRANNAWSNLRQATRSQNAANITAHAHNRLGLKGVYQRGPNAFCASIKVDGRTTHLGTYATPEDAHAAYLEAANDAFGEFARVA